MVDEMLDALGGADDKTGQEAVTDPGENEGRKPEAKKPEPPAGSPRWNEIYRANKENERKTKELEAKLAEKDRDIEDLRRHNQAVAEALEELKTAKAEGDKDVVEETYRTTLQALRDQRKAAIANDDKSTAADIQDKIDDLREERTKWVVNREKEKEKEKEKTADAGAAPDVSAAVAEFVSSSPWYDENHEEYDELMASAAKGLSSKLSADPAWANKSAKVFLAEVKKRVEARFGYGKKDEDKDKDKDEQRRPFEQNLGGVDTSGNRGTKTVTLSPEERRVARLLNPDDPNAEIKYAEQLKVLRKGAK